MEKSQISNISSNTWKLDLFLATPTGLLGTTFLWRRLIPVLSSIASQKTNLQLNDKEVLGHFWSQGLQFWEVYKDICSKFFTIQHPMWLLTQLYYREKYNKRIKPTNYMSIWKMSVKVSMLWRTRVKRPTQHHQRQFHISLEHTKVPGFRNISILLRLNLLFHCSPPSPTPLAD